MVQMLLTIPEYSLSSCNIFLILSILIIDSGIFVDKSKYLSKTII